jgi:hypothetical protein
LKRGSEKKQLRKVSGENLFSPDTFLN